MGSSLDRRLRLLEAGNKPGSCIECELRRLNLTAAGLPMTEQPCGHRRGITFADELRRLNETEILGAFTHEQS